MSSSSSTSASMGVCVQSSPLSAIGNTVNMERSRAKMKRQSDSKAKIQTSSAEYEGKENEEPFVGESDTEEDEEVFFGSIITNKERSKMAKLRRKTQVFVANFRDLSSSGSGTGKESLEDLMSSMDHSPSSQASSVKSSSIIELESPVGCQISDKPGASAAAYQLPKPSHLERMALSSMDSPSILANRAAAKIQTWFRLTRQAQEYQGVMRRMELLEAKTDDFIQKICREKERIRQCSTPEQGGRLDTAGTSPLVIVPTHRLHLVESSPQQANDFSTQQSPNPAQLSLDLDDTAATDAIFNAANDSVCINDISGGTRSSPIPVKFDGLLAESSSTQLDTLQPNDSESSCSSEQENCDIPDQHEHGTCQNEAGTSVVSRLCSTPNLVHSGAVSQETPVSSVSTLYQGAYSKVASAVKAHTRSGDCSVSEQSESNEQMFNEGNGQNKHDDEKNDPSAADSLVLQVDQTSAPQCTPLRPLQMSGTLSSFPKITYGQLQGPTVFSSPRLFPVTVQAVQSLQSISSAVLFSPLKISGRKPVKDQRSGELMSHSFSPQVKTQRSQTEKESENQNLTFDFDTHEPTALNAATERKNVDCRVPLQTNNSTASTSVVDLLKSPNVGVLKSAQKFAIITPNSAILPTSGSVSKSHRGRLETEQEDLPLGGGGPGQQLVSTKEQGRFHFFPSPLVITRDTQETKTTPAAVTNSTGQAASRLEAAYGGQPGVKTSPFTGARGSESARRKLELLELKKAELARLRAEKAELKQTLKTENEMCFIKKQEVKAALRSNTSQTNIPMHLLSLGCQGTSSLTLTDQELDMVTRLHTIRNSHHDNLQGMAASPMVTPTPHKGWFHLKWHSDLVTQVHHLSSPGHPVQVARPILANQNLCKARRLPVARTASPAQRVPTRQDRPRYPSSHTSTPREKLAF